MAKKPGLGERLCSKCKEVIKADATICKHCRTEFTPEEMAQAQKDQRYNNKVAGFGCLAVVLLLGFCVYTADGEKPTTSAPPTAASKSGGGKAAVAEQAVEEPASTLSGPQQNALRSAQSYIAMTGFSRDGLIDQLSSEAGSGYSVADATAAVDSMDIDWNEQAARSAKSYLDMTGFSCNGLVDQLASSAGSQYTRSQAIYGAKQAGAC